MKNFKNTIWTNHALDRLKERGISQSDAWATWNNPDHSRPGAAPESFVYYKTYGNQKIEVVAKKNERREWIILSVWSKHISESNKKISIWKKLLMKLIG